MAEEYKEYEVYDRVIRDLFRKGEDEARRNISNVHHGITFTDKQKYFIGKLNLALSHAYYLAKDIQDESILWEVGKGIGLTAAAVGIGKIGTSFIGNNQALDVVAYTGGVVAAIFSIKNIKDKVDAKNTATKIINFLENTDTFGFTKFGVNFACELYLEFRIAIEMMIKSERGIDILVNFFIERILEIIAHTPTSRLSTLTDYQKRAELIKLELILHKIPDTEIKTEGLVQNNLKWNLQELLQHAPAIVCLPLEKENSYKFIVYINTACTKSRFLHIVEAEASHKYPPRLMYSRSNAVYSAGYTRNKPNAAPLVEDTFFIPDFMSPTFNMRLETYGKYILFFNDLRQLKRNPNQLDLLASAVNSFNKLADELLNFTPSSNITCFNLFVELQMLRNVYWNVLSPLTRNHSDNDDNPIYKAIATMDSNFKQISLKYSDEKRTKEIEFSKIEASHYIYDRESDIKTTPSTKNAYKNDSDFMQDFLSKYQ